MSDKDLIISPERVAQRLSIALTKLSLSSQSMQDEADSLVFNEDQENLNRIAAFLVKAKKAEKAIEEEHKIIKEPHLAASRACDSAKKDVIGVISSISEPVRKKYTELCESVDRKKREQEQRIENEKRILAGIEANVLTFSQEIAGCFDKKSLTDIERKINLEKSPTRSSKYGDFHQKAIERFDEILIPILKDQKRKIDERDELQKQLESSNSAEKHDELMQKLEEKGNEILQNQVKIQETALNQASVETEHEVIMPEVKAKRTDVVAEIVDVSVVFKKNPELLNIELRVIEAKKQGAFLRDSGAFGDKEELIVNGIKYSIRKSW